MEHYVVDPGASLAGDCYALPASGVGESGMGGAPTALPRMDGTDGEEIALPGAAMTPDKGAQPPWGWGAAPARALHGAAPAEALTDLPTNPQLYTARQQDAVRRDVAARLGAYAEYSPESFVG